MNTKTNLTRTFRAQDSKGKEHLIEEYIVYEEIISGKLREWQKLERFMFLNGNLVKYNEEEQTFTDIESNKVLKCVG